VELAALRVGVDPVVHGDEPAARLADRLHGPVDVNDVAAERVELPDDHAVGLALAHPVASHSVR
jgi:hypothetical protein